ncbi:hypothetical protein BS329_27380 [Amycolatopsis coloradensis]|uniref:Uncharacterized protein n=1 Tax=Amycolatopsis coloradensis TaxID=76021 RepID=A0A1R0KLS9_9PSEU|nr:hypothetical protein BS329_27380 [Amycolatopsis coloradensis]
MYVGKAEAGNSEYGYEPNYDATKLFERINKHAKSVFEVENSAAGGNLSLDDLRVKFLFLDHSWISLGERALLRAYRLAFWNTIVNGFGSTLRGQLAETLDRPGIPFTQAEGVRNKYHIGNLRCSKLGIE